VVSTAALYPGGMLCEGVRAGWVFEEPLALPPALLLPGLPVAIPALFRSEGGVGCVNLPTTLVARMVTVNELVSKR